MVTNSSMIDLDSTAVNYTPAGDEMLTSFEYRRNELTRLPHGRIRVSPRTHAYQFKTQLKPHKTGLMLVGIGGNNGTTVAGSIIANQHKMSWRTKTGVQEANYWGSITQSTTVHLGFDGTEQVYIPFKSVLPMVEPNSLVIDGWDVNGMNLADAMERAQVFEPELQSKVRPYMETLIPRPSIHYPDFVASNQSERANHVIANVGKAAHVQRIRDDIADFKQKHQLDCVIVLWTASTERFCDVRRGLNQTADELLASIERSDPEVAPSQIFAVAAILEGAHYINGSPQNTLVPGVVELAARHPGVFLGGDDFKSGQTKLKSALVEFLVSTGVKPQSIVSYNHLGNNDGKNLSEHRQFRSKEVTKSSVVDDMVAANHILYPEGKNPDHAIVIKYVPYVGDSKRAMDEYVSSIFMGGHHTLVIHNTCEDSLLAAPLIIDLALITELCSRIRYQSQEVGGDETQWVGFHPVLSLLSCLLKAPNVPPGTPVCNALMRQLQSVTKLLTAVAGMHSDTDMQLEFFTRLPPTTAATMPTTVGERVMEEELPSKYRRQENGVIYDGMPMKNGTNGLPTEGVPVKNGATNGFAH